MVDKPKGLPDKTDVNRNASSPILANLFEPGGGGVLLCFAALAKGGEHGINPVEHLVAQVQIVLANK